jgi:hypothetical protein
MLEISDPVNLSFFSHLIQVVVPFCPDFTKTNETTSTMVNVLATDVFNLKCL